jgi:GT2 family glycosyltransferase
VAVPTLVAGAALAECLRSLEAQTFDAFEIVVIDNSGSSQVQASGERTRVITNTRNVGFGSAVNQAARASSTPYLATLNDDAVAHPQWLEQLVESAETNPRVGMFASQVRLPGGGESSAAPVLDSAGMLIAADGTGKQRGHLQPPSQFEDARESLFPSGSAALYRRAMLDQIGLFDETFFIYCEDVDLGLRARWAGWECLYVPGAVVDHRYSESAGRASPLKAYYVERNRLFTVIKNFPLGMLVRAPFASIARYLWHVISLDTGKGKTVEFRQAGHSFALLPFLVLRAHVAALLRLPRLLVERRRIRASRTIDAIEFTGLLQRHAIAVRRVATL